MKEFHEIESNGVGFSIRGARSTAAMSSRHSRPPDHLIVRSEGFHGLETPVIRAVVVVFGLALLSVGINIHSLAAEMPAGRELAAR